MSGAASGETMTEKLCVALKLGAPLSATLTRKKLLDPYLNGSYQEFRIYGGLLSDSDIKYDYSTGPESVGVDYVLHAFPVSNALTLTWGPSAGAMNLESSPALGPD